MTNRVNFIEHEHGRYVKANGEKNQLLSYLLITYKTQYDLPQLIHELEQVESGEKTFDDIQEPNGYLSFAEGLAYLECDKKTAYLVSFDKGDEPDIEMPLKELIAIMKEWQAFLGV